MIFLCNAESEIKIEGFSELLIPKFTDKEFKSHFRLNRNSIKVNRITFIYYYLLVMLKTKINVIYLL